MGMFETTGWMGGGARKAATLQKLERMRKALRHREPDRVPISDFFWGGFLRRWRKELDLPPDANPYYHYDLDWIVTVPNMDPWIRPFQTLKETADEVVVKTGFGAVMRKKFACPMPEMTAWETDTFEKLEAVEFDPLRPDFPVYGSMIECAECLTRLIGQQNTMLWMGLYPDRMGKVINRIGEFYTACAKAEIDAGEGLLDGFVIWGDVAYKRGLFFSPDYWRQYFKPWVKAMADYAHRKGLPVIYHGCGNVGAIFEDYIEIGIDAYNPLEVKAGMDAIELRRKYDHRMAFCGNSDVQVWETGDKNEIRRQVLRKLNAAKGGGFIFQSDHSVTSNVSGRTYDYIVKLVREHGTYPLDLGQFDEAL
jgi:uroporphyrinogen decarboxylase